MKISLKLMMRPVLLVLGAILLFSCTTPASPATAVPPQGTGAPTAVPLVIPFREDFLASGHADVNSEAFKHWDADGKVPVTCARCHTSAGYQEFAASGTITREVPAPAGGLNCDTCHNAAAIALKTVQFPSGKTVTPSASGEARCLVCHQGRESKISVDDQITAFNVTDVDAVVAPIKDANGQDRIFGFRNVHYFAAGAVLYGTQSQIGYEYASKEYDPRFAHVEGLDTCTACHDQHGTKVRVEACAECHQGVKAVEDLQNVRMEASTMDYNGNGDVKEGIAKEIAGLQEVLLGSIQAYATEVAGMPIAYDGETYPYFMVAGADGKPALTDGKTTTYGSWTARLLKAAYNYQVSLKDPGAFAHNGKYIIQLLYDSIEDLNGKIAKPVDMTKMARMDSGHFASSEMAFRDWDDAGLVPAGCAKCHSATGLPTFLANSGNLLMAKTGVQVTGVVGQPASSGFACATCHDTANFPNRLAVTTVPFPSGVALTFSTEKDANGKLVPVDSNACLECHQGRESTATMNNYLADKPADTVDAALGFKNVHYFAAGATLFGDAAKVAYQYEGQKYAGQNTEHDLNQCTQCHDAHELGVKLAACSVCHPSVKTAEDLPKIRKSTVDYNGNGDVTEGIAAEVMSFQDALIAAIQTKAEKNGTPILYSAESYPYWFVDADKNGKPDTTADGKVATYNAWTPNLLKAAYNYQFALKDPGAWSHNPMYILQILYDSTKSIGGNVAKFTRP